jgi:SAM-dependent methyltransferase
MRDVERGLRLLPPDVLVKTGDVDHADWNYRPVLGRIMRLRFKLVAALLDGEDCGRLLEIGYGSGVLMPELSRRSAELFGLDVHAMPREVSVALARRDIKAGLFTGSATAMPFADEFFDCVVAVSALEFVDDLDAACVEIRRVLKPGGSLVVVTPGFSPLADFGLKVLTGKNAKDDFGERRRRMIPTLKKHFKVERQLSAPPLGGTLLRLYTALRLRRPQ